MTFTSAQCMPAPFGRSSTTSLLALSTMPLPIGQPSARKRGRELRTQRGMTGSSKQPIHEPSCWQCCSIPTFPCTTMTWNWRRDAGCANAMSASAPQSRDGARAWDSFQTLATTTAKLGVGLFHSSPRSYRHARNHASLSRARSPTGGCRRAIGGLIQRFWRGYGYSTYCSVAPFIKPFDVLIKE